MPLPLTGPAAHNSTAMPLPSFGITCWITAAALQHSFAMPPTCSLDLSFQEDRAPLVLESELTQDDTEAWVSTILMAQLLEHGKRHYKGVARLGIEAMELKIKGYSGADIARLYHTKSNHVGAWIARAVEKLRQDAAVADPNSARTFEKTA